jgi:uncharacterized protein YggE
MNRLVVASVLGLFLSVFAMSAHASDKPPVPSITVVGSDEVSAPPDTAELLVGVVTQAPAASKALKENNQAVQKLFATLKGLGIADKDMQTSNFNIVPQNKRGPQGQIEPEIVGYQVNNQLHVKVRELPKLGDVLDLVVTDGANSIHGVNFSVDKPKDLQDQARQKAVADARRKAELYAKATGVKVGKVLLIQEETAHSPQPVMFAGRAEAGVPIAPGEQRFHARITITYAIDY